MKLISLPKTALLLFSTLLLVNQHSYAADNPADFTALFQQPASSAALTTLSQQLAPSAQAKGDFTQYRYLKVLKKPLISKGNFLFSKQLGIIWQQTAPFMSTLILQAGRLTQIDSQGQIQVTKAQQSAAASQMSQLMPTLLNALLSGDLHTLQQHFTLSLAPADNKHHQWLLGLIPTDPLVQKIMPRLVLIGQQRIETLILFSDKQDRSRIEFSAINEQALTPQEQARFSPSQPQSSARVSP